jgi:hypothetical protein
VGVRTITRTTDDATGFGAGVFTLSEYVLSIYKHVNHAQRILFWIFKCGHIFYVERVKNGEVSVIPSTDSAAIRDLKI